MATMDSKSDGDKRIDELNALIETNLDAVRVNTDALQGLQSPELKTMVQNALNDHAQAASRLQARVRELGGQPAMSSHMSSKLTESWQELWEKGGDREVLLALRANERVNVDGFKVNLTKENVMKTMSEEGLDEHRTALEMEVRHFQQITDALREMGVSVDNDELTGAVRNALEHVHAAINLSGTAMEAFAKWATGRTN